MYGGVYCVRALPCRPPGAISALLSVISIDGTTTFTRNSPVSEEDLMNGGTWSADTVAMQDDR